MCSPLCRILWPDPVLCGSLPLQFSKSVCTFPRQISMRAAVAVAPLFWHFPLNPLCYFTACFLLFKNHSPCFFLACSTIFLPAPIWNPEVPAGQRPACVSYSHYWFVSNIIDFCQMSFLSVKNIIACSPVPAACAPSGLTRPPSLSLSLCVQR